jgi:hypothetical protein
MNRVVKAPSLLRRWREERRFRNTLRQLQSLSPTQLQAHGIPAHEIPRLASIVARG